MPVEVQAIAAGRLQNVSNNPEFSSISSGLSAVVATIKYDMLIDLEILKQKLSLIVGQLVDFYVNEVTNTKYPDVRKKKHHQNNQAAAAEEVAVITNYRKKNGSTKPRKEKPTSY